MKRLIALTILFGLIFLTACLAEPDFKSFQQERAEALKLVDKYAQALDSTASFIEHYERTSEYTGHFPPGHPAYATHGDKEFRHHISERGTFKFKQDKGQYHSRYLSGYHAGYFNDYNKYIPEDKPMYTLRIHTMDAYYFHQGRPGLARWRKDTKTFPIPKHGLQVGAGLSHLSGHVETKERLDEVLQQGDYISVRDETETIRGSECFVIDAHTRYGQFSLWLDPDHGFHAAKIRKSAKGGESFAKPDRIIPRGSIYTSYLDVLEFKKVDDIWVPVDANAGYHRTIGDPAYYVAEDVRYKRTQITLNPDHDKLGSFANPIFEEPSNDPELVNGTMFEIETERQHVEYTWQDGELFDDNGRALDMDKLKEWLEDEDWYHKSIE
jgi:hypothetical protein